MREKITEIFQQTSLSLGQSEIQAVRRKVSKRTGCRVYKQDNIGIAGAIGEANEEELYAKAERNLSYKIDYPVEATENKRVSINIDECKLNDNDLFEAVEEILKKTAERHSNFTINHKANLNTVELGLENEGQTKLYHKDKFVELGLLLKKRGSSDILDTAFSYIGRQVNPGKVIESVSELITAFEREEQLPAETLPIILHDRELTKIFQKDLSGKLFGNKASLFQEQLGAKVFNEKFSLKIANDPMESFSPIFDSEGTIAEASANWLIRDGKIIRPYTDKRTAKMYNFENTGCAGGSYDGVPTLHAPHLEIMHSEQTLKSLLNGKMGILIMMAGGGDFTPDGIFASPVQLAYLTDGERLIGKLPHFTIKGSIYNIFGKDFIGVSSDKHFTVGNERLFVTNMKLTAL
ncbi:MAG: metallopeptidase TldD-related protein [Candidatus Riflebacteria bacterium]|nr:metallopeptidase TldD-related protein [Candidatus Riflebacteria bacterium]